MTRRSVALLIETSNAYARGVLEGAVDYVRQHDAWSIYLPEQERAARPPKWLSSWRGDGIIARIETDEIARATETDLSLNAIATRTGFQHDEYMSVAFKKAVGVPSSKYRQSERTRA